MTIYGNSQMELENHSHIEVPHYPAMDMDQITDISMDTDIMLGAYLLSHLHNTCENCGTSSTPQWRKGWFSQLLNRTVLLCNACGIKYAKGQFCNHCNYVYGKEHGQHNNPDQWLTCSSCYRWVHIECERRQIRSFVEQNGSLPQVDYLDSNGNLIPSAFQCSTCIKAPHHPVKAML